MKLRVVTWNMNHWQSRSMAIEAWDYLYSLNADISLVQEAVKPEPPSNYNGRPINQSGRNWGSGIVTNGLVHTPVTLALSRHNSKSKGPVEVLRTWPGTVAISEVVLADGTKVTAISCYGLIDNGYAQTTMFRIIADLIPLFDDPKLGKRVILAGDLNIGTQQKKDMIERERHNAILVSIKSLGLVDCFEITKQRRPTSDCDCIEAPECGHVTTHIHRTRKSRTQNDYIFVTKNLSEKLTDCFVLDGPSNFSVNSDGSWKLSDHCPVMAEFNI